MSGGTTIQLMYHNRLDADKLIFLATAGDTKLFIKFTQRYGAEAHKYCSDKGIAPRLHEVVLLQGGWRMVIMDYLDEHAFTCISPSDKHLKANILKAIDILHGGGLVHGDVRGVNMMKSTKNGETVIMLLDFDWAGKDGEVQYPGVMNLSVNRPSGVIRGGLIQMDHDVAMVNLLFL